MVRYFKTQWFSLLIAIICLGISAYYALQPAAETLTVETLDEAMSARFTATRYFFCFLIWIFMSFIHFNSDRIELLKKKAEKYDALAEEVSALYEANRIDREHMKLLEQKINQLKYDWENEKL